MAWAAIPLAEEQESDPKALACFWVYTFLNRDWACKLLAPLWQAVQAWSSEHVQQKKANKAWADRATLFRVLQGLVQLGAKDLTCLACSRVDSTRGADHCGEQARQDRCATMWLAMAALVSW